jgi:hypothetical protein
MEENIINKNTNTLKCCSNCLVQKNINEFTNYSRKICKVCYNQKALERVKKHREKDKKVKIVTDTKICKECEIETPIENFTQRRNICKGCFNKNRKIRYQTDKNDKVKFNKMQEYGKEYRSKNIYKRKEAIIKVLKENKTKDKKLYQRNYINERCKNDILFKVAKNARSMVYRAFIKSGYKKNSKTETIIGCSFEQLKEHIEKQFEPWMNWDNWGLYNGNLNYGWDIDHIEPLFPPNKNRTHDDIIKLNSYINLQPLCSKINRTVKRNYI